MLVWHCRSVFYLPKPLPLNHLVRDLYRGRALVLQGAKDPLNDARGRAAALQESCPNISVHLMDAGHCPVSHPHSTFLALPPPTRDVNHSLHWVILVNQISDLNAGLDLPQAVLLAVLYLFE